MAMIPNTPENFDAMRDMFGPQQVDSSIRQALQMCWLSLPKEKRTVGNVEIHIRRLVDRALKNMHDDAGQFGFLDT